MSGPAGIGVLRDPALAQADRTGLLPAAASAGAQVRSVLASASDLPGVDRPRAMVVVGADAAADTAFLTALIGRSASAPVLAARRLPPWVGALDVVVVLAANPDDEEAAEAAGIARRRGATVIVRGAEHGPVAEAAGPSLFPPAVAVPEALAAPARWSLLATVAARAGLSAPVELGRTADLLDATALACHPGAETFLNPGVNLAEYLTEGTGLLIGCDPLGDALAAHGARVLADLGGVVAGVLTAAQAGSSPSVLRRIGGPKDLFADPFDGDEPGQLVKPLLVSTSPEAPGAPGAMASETIAQRRALAALLRAFAGAMHLDGSADSLPAVTGVPEYRPDPSGPGETSAPALNGQPADSFDAAIAASLRLDFAAVYVGIAAGQLVPMDFPDGLGRSGGTRWAVRPATVGDRREREQDVNTWN